MLIANGRTDCKVKNTHKCTFFSEGRKLLGSYNFCAFTNQSGFGIPHKFRVGLDVSDRIFCIQNFRTCGCPNSDTPYNIQMINPSGKEGVGARISSPCTAKWVPGTCLEPSTGRNMRPAAVFRFRGQQFLSRKRALTIPVQGGHFRSVFYTIITRPYRPTGRLKTKTRQRGIDFGAVEVSAEVAITWAISLRSF